MANDFFSTDVYVPTPDGYFVSEKQMRIAEIINDYDPSLSLVWIPPDKRVAGDKAFAIVCHPTNGESPPYYVMYADECDERLLAKLINADNTRQNVLDELEAHNLALELVKAKKEQEEMEAKADYAKFLFGSKKHTVQLGNGRVLRK